MTFVPSFLFIFLGAPYLERLRNNRALAGALTGITAAVVIANLALYFAVSTLFARTRVLDAGPLALQLPEWTTLRAVALVIGIVAAVLLFVARWPVLRVLGISALSDSLLGCVGCPSSEQGFRLIAARR